MSEATRYAGAAATVSAASKSAALPRRLAVAPMMERTDRHCRSFLRLLAPHAWLYTEMITAAALLHGDRRALLAFSAAEHPVALQLGGADARELAEAARHGAAAGYDEINLNVGCPSGRVQAGCFGAALMREPERVADCVRAMRGAVDVPVTVKTRLGVDHLDSYAFLCDFVGSVAEAGCGAVIVHARKAWLEGLSPKQNREVPSLDYGRVRRLKRDFPELEILLNGGLTEVDTTLAELEHVDGVMLGRAAYSDPYVLARLDAAIFAAASPAAAASAAAASAAAAAAAAASAAAASRAGRPPARGDVLRAFVPYLEHEVGRGTPLKRMTRHLMGLYAGVPGGRQWRRTLTALPSAPEQAVAGIAELAAAAGIAELAAAAEGLASAEGPVAARGTRAA